MSQWLAHIHIFWLFPTQPTWLKVTMDDVLGVAAGTGQEYVACECKPKPSRAPKTSQQGKGDAPQVCQLSAQCAVHPRPKASGHWLEPLNSQVCHASGNVGGQAHQCGHIRHVGGSLMLQPSMQAGWRGDALWQLASWDQLVVAMLMDGI